MNVKLLNQQVKISFTRSALLFIILTLAVACSSKNESETASTSEDVVEELEPELPVYEYAVVGLEFDGPTSIPSGWTTIRLKNMSAMVHFALIERLPEGITVEDQQDSVAPVFQNFMDNFNGKELSEPEIGMELPAWFGNIVFLGGPGLTSPNTTSEATLYLQPGNYMMECYVKTDGIFHSYNPDPDRNGMVLGLTVTDETSSRPEPTATSELVISSENGFELRGTPSLGENTIKVTFTDQNAYANFVGHDVHLVKLTEGASLDSVNAWMDWTKPHGLETPAPATFLGGVNEMPPGQTSYMNVTLEPGDYAFVAEVPDPASKNLLVTFTLQ